MTAQEAREASDARAVKLNSQRRLALLDEIKEEIDQAISLGKYDALVYDPHKVLRFSDLSPFRDQGYTTRMTPATLGNGSVWQTIYISW